MKNNMDAFLQARHVSKKVKSGEDQLTILNDINLSINTSESIAILGASGSGKTTLLTLLAGLDLPTTGDIFFANHHLSILSEDERAKIRAKYVGFVFQSFQLLSSLTALENVMLPLEIQSKPLVLAKEEAKDWLHKVGLDKRLHHYPTKLSGGEQQRVAIARAFVGNRKIIFADEMTGNLDSKTGKLVSDILFSLNELHQTTLVIVTHDHQLANRCNQQFILHDGALIAC
jgi:putative ABC transport system ATP-binding protein